MLEHFRAQWSKITVPIAKGLLRIGLKPDALTWIGTIAASLVAIICFPNGWLWQGALISVLFLVMDSFDGQMARTSGSESSWGAFLDSTLDRITDGIVIGSLAFYYAMIGQPIWVAVGIAALIFGQVTSYAKARGQSLGANVAGGLIGRADRLVIAVLGALVSGLGISWALPAALTILSVMGAFTVGQRMVAVYRQMTAK